MSNDSFIRRIKRKALREQGKTFTERMQEAVRLGHPVSGVNFVKGTKTVTR